MMRRLVWIAVCLVAGCAALQSGPPPKKAEVEAETEETGVKGISRLLRQSNRQLAGKQFGGAMTLLRRAERSIQTASPVTRSHPDYDDLESAVERARRRLEAAIEKDRIERRNAAIDALIRRGKATLRQGTTLFNELRARVPTKLDVATLGEIITRLATFRGDGMQYMDEPRYASHAEDRDAKAASLTERRDQAAWALKAGAPVRAAIEDAHRSVDAVKRAESPTDFVAAFRKAAQGFSRCAKAISDLEADVNYRGDQLVDTRLGMHSLAKTKRMCTERGAKARKEADKREWTATIARVVESISEPVTAMRAAKRASEMLSTGNAAMSALKKCQTALDAVSRHPGTNASRAFATALGSLTHIQLRQRCRAEESRFTKGKPRLEWRSALESAADRTASIEAKMETGTTAETPRARVDAWRAAVGGLRECVDGTKKLLAQKTADRGFSPMTPFGKLSAQGLQKECVLRLSTAQKKLALANKDLMLEEFIATCKADEIAVARREGIPDRVEPVDGGRMFVYESRGKRKNESRHYGFDTNGNRVDFRLRWLGHVSSVVSEVSRVLQKIHHAANGEDALTATQEAIRQFEVCTEAMASARKSPGYDAAAVFKTPLGKMPAAKLGLACAAERARRAKTLESLKWRIELEDLRDRVNDAATAMSLAKVASDGATRAEKISIAIGGYQECSERIEPLGYRPGADKNLKVDSTHGKLTLRGFAKICAAQIKQAQKSLEQALADQELETFIATCKADEVEVARRQGMPTRVEEVGSGRVFVYVSKSKRKSRSKAKRFAFNAAGKRVDEKALRAAGKKKGTSKAKKPGLMGIPSN
ncbi:MAG: hypothetical protein V3T05_05405 [Myxococcota bacterium]